MKNIEKKYLISIDLDAIRKGTRVTRNSRGDTILMIDLDCTPGIHRSNNGNYYLNLVAVPKKKGLTFGTHTLLQYLKADEVRTMKGRGETYPPVGNMNPWDKEKAMKLAQEKHFREWGADPKDVDEYWEGRTINEKFDCDDSGDEEDEDEHDDDDDDYDPEYLPDF